MPNRVLMTLLELFFYLSFSLRENMLDSPYKDKDVNSPPVRISLLLFFIL